jgi:hypothetical protein
MPRVTGIAPLFLVSDEVRDLDGDVICFGEEIKETPRLSPMSSP